MSFLYSDFSGESLELSIVTVVVGSKSGDSLPHQGMPELGLIMELVERLRWEENYSLGTSLSPV